MGDKNTIKDLRRKIEVLIMAIPRELEAYDFYKEIATQYDDTTSREMFTFLANQELAHKESLEKLLAGLQAKLEAELNS